MNSRWFLPNRYVCSCIDELRDVSKELNPWRIKKQKRLLLSIAEEIQVYVNRMEAGLNDQKDILACQEKMSKIKKELKQLEDKKEALKEEIKLLNEALGNNNQSIDSANIPSAIDMLSGDD